MRQQKPSARAEKMTRERMSKRRIHRESEAESPRPASASSE